MSVLKQLCRAILYVYLFTYCTFLSAQVTPAKEYQVKAACLFNFTHFVEWPATSFETGQSPLIIGVLGENPFGTYLEELVKGELVNGHPLVIAYYQRTQDIHTCHVLFINESDPDKLVEIVRSLSGRNILTVSNRSEGNLQEEIIRFIIINNKVHFQINPEAAKKENLVISSKLLGLSNIYISEKK